MRFSRRTFIKTLSCSMCIAGTEINPLNLFTPAKAYASSPTEISFTKEVMYYKKLDDLRIECQTCPKKCRIADLERGYCGNKENRGGTYYSLVYSRPCAVHTDPIEKKPLFHYLPSTMALSIATAGCNFECRFCQNWQIAQYRPEQIESSYVPPEKIVHRCLTNNTPTIAYTYSEPVVFYEYMYDCAKLGRKHGVGSVMISNGFIKEKPLTDLCSHLTAVKIDLKAFSDDFYKKYCSGRLDPVLNSLKILKQTGTWFEIVVLIIPGLNDNPDEIRSMSRWIRENLGADVPVHFSRFQPMYKLKNLPPTPLPTLERCCDIAATSGIHYVYIGNVPGHKRESTYCPGCGKNIIRRFGFTVIENNIRNGKCAFCGRPVAGVWEPL